MTPTNVILKQLSVLLATDATMLADAANPLHVHLIQNSFTPSPTLLIGGLVLATFDGSTPKNAGLGAQQEFVDGASGRRTVQLLEPAGGWHWVVTGTTDLPQTINGFAVTDTGDTVVYGSERFDVPINLSYVGQAVDIGRIRLIFASTIFQ